MSGVINIIVPRTKYSALHARDQSGRRLQTANRILMAKMTEQNVR
jgi:hypothetical protein